jgi:monovalent cation:proton antiporter-2 (CPA2) family protein
MHNQEFFYQALIYLAAAVVSVPIAKRLGFGSVLGYLFAGVIIGPFVLGLIGEEGGDIMHFGEFGVVMMLFLIGLELKPSLLWSMKKSIFGLGGLQLLLTAILIMGIALLAGQSLAQSIAIGLILALSSTAIVLQTLSEKGLMKYQVGKNAFSVLLFQDISIIPILAVIPFLAYLHDPNAHFISSQEHSFVDTLFGWQKLLLILALVLSIIFIGRFIARYIFRIIANTELREIFTAAALLLVILIAVAMDFVGLSPALGAFLGGVVLADNEYRHELESDIEPFKGLLLGLFFIAVGASIDFSLFVHHTGLIVLLLTILISVKFVVLLILGRFFGLRSGRGLLFSFALAQGGEFAFVLISFSKQNFLFNEHITSILLLVVALSMVMAPILLFLDEHVIQPQFTKTTNREEEAEIESLASPVIIAGFGRFGVVIGRLLMSNGFSATVLDNSPQNIQLLRKFGFHVYYGDASRPDLLRAAGANDARILVVAIDEKDKANEIIDYAQRHFPHLKIFARATNMLHVYELIQKEVSDVRREYFDAALELGKNVLHELGFTRYQAHRASKIFRYHDDEVVQELYQHWLEDEDKYIDEVKRQRLELEDTLTQEKEQSIHESDTAWDTKSRREEIRKLLEEMKKDTSDS